MNKFILAAATSLSLTAFSLLSPTAQAIAEVQRIFTSKEILTAFGGPDFIVSCEKTDTGYLIQTNDSRMLVTVEYEPQDKPGPKKFHLIFGPIESIDP